MYNIAYGGTNSNVMLPYPSMATPSTATSNVPTTYHGNSNTPYPLYSNHFPTPPSYPTASANTTNFLPYTPPYPAQNSSQNCSYPQQPVPARPEYPPYPTTAGATSNTTSGVSII